MLQLYCFELTRNGQTRNVLGLRILAAPTGIRGVAPFGWLVTHRIDDGGTYGHPWIRAYNNITEFIDAPYVLRDFLVRRMLEGAETLVLQVFDLEGYPTFTFDVYGFKESAQPLLELCGQ